MENPFDETATQTIDLLEARLRRIEYVVHGQEYDHTGPEDHSESASARLERLDRALYGLTVKSKVIKDLLQLHSQYPEIFQSTTSPEVPTSLSLSTQQAIILASPSAYNLTASSLTSVMDVPVPSAESSIQLIQLKPRLAKAKLRQETQTKEISELRGNTARILQRWYTLHILGVGECWSDYERRVQELERGVRRVAVRAAENE